PRRRRLRRNRPHRRLRQRPPSPRPRPQRHHLPRTGCGAGNEAGPRWLHAADFDVGADFGAVWITARETTLAAIRVTSWSRTMELFNLQAAPALSLGKKVSPSKFKEILPDGALEQDLEDLIVAYPWLLNWSDIASLDPDLLIISRQPRTQTGKR